MMKTRLQRWLVSLGILGLFGAALLVPGTALAAPRTSQAKAIPHANICVGEYVYGITSYTQKVQHVTEPSQAYDNDTGMAVDATFTSLYQRSQSFQYTASFKVSASVIFLSIRDTLNIQATQTVTATAGKQAHLNVPAGGTGVGTYGVFGVSTSGNYFYQHIDCSITDYGNVDAWSPWGFGWETSIVNG